MFTYIKLKNYKSLIELEVDLTKKENTPKTTIMSCKMARIEEKAMRYSNRIDI